MKKESKKKVKKSNKNSIFSPRNLLIGFVVIIILLLIFNYFYPVFSINNRFFNQNYNNGKLYSTTGGSSNYNECKNKVNGDSCYENGQGGVCMNGECKKDCKDIKCNRCDKCIQEKSGPICKRTCNDCQYCYGPMIDINRKESYECRAIGGSPPVTCRNNGPSGDYKGECFNDECPKCKNGCGQCELCRKNSVTGETSCIQNPYSNVVCTISVVPGWWNVKGVCKDTNNDGKLECVLLKK